MSERAAPDEALLRRLFDAAAEPLLAIDGNGTILEANGAAARFLGRHLDSLVGKPLAALVALPDRRRFRRALHALTEHEGTRTVDVRVGRADAAARLELSRFRSLSIVVSVRTAPRDDGGSDDHRHEDELVAVLALLPTGVVRIGQNRVVTFANAAAAQVLPQLRTGRPFPHDTALAGPVARLLERGAPMLPRLVDLDDGRILRVTGVRSRRAESALLLVDDVTAAVRQAEAQREFVRNAAHQLRTPLAGIASAVEVLQSGAKDDPAERERFIDHIARETARLSRLGSALLILARAQSGAQAPRFEFVPVAPLLDRIAADLRARPSVVVEAHAPNDLAAFVEPDLLDEALRALADNAAQHTREGSVTLRAFRCGDRQLEIEIVDTGDGILPEHLGRIFDPFYRASPDRGGFGLGLAIAQQAVTAMGGELGVTSAPREGTRFAVRVPSADIVRG